MFLHWLFAGLGVLLTDIVYLLSPALSHWWRLPLALAGYVTVSALYILLLYIISLIPEGQYRYYGDACHLTVQVTIPWLVSLLGLRIRVEGQNRLPDQPFLLVSNHRSNWDPLVTVAAFKERKISFVSKPENFRLPVAGGWMRRAAFLPIDRENPRKAITAIHEAANLITDHDLSVGLYPEGTRNKAAQLLPLLPFHNGSLKIAKLAKCPIATVAIHYEKGPLWLRTARLTVVDILDTDTVAASRPDALSERVQQAIITELEKQ